MSSIITALWDVTLCSLVEEGEDGAPGSIETLVPIYQTARHHIPDNRNLDLIYRRFFFMLHFYTEK
jgi:hypothetical protein